jgi:hypothetical protein
MFLINWQSFLNFDCVLLLIISLNFKTSILVKYRFFNAWFSFVMEITASHYIMEFVPNLIFLTELTYEPQLKIGVKRVQICNQLLLLLSVIKFVYFRKIPSNTNFIMVKHHLKTTRTCMTWDSLYYLSL